MKVKQGKSSATEPSLTLIFGGVIFVACIVIALVYAMPDLVGLGEARFSFAEQVASTSNVNPPKPKVLHVQTPDAVKGIYMTSWIGGRKDLRQPLVELIDQTELNTIVLDIKDYSGKLAFAFHDPEIAKYEASENRISDIDAFLEELHKKDIYVIGRVSVFQDSHMVKARPEWALTSKMTGKVWKDRNGVMWIEPHARPFWEYIVSVGKEAYARGFDEINFDYIRFPTDGVMTDIIYPFEDGKAKAEVMREFFVYLREQFPTTIPISADIFGMTTTNRDDLGIGQVLEYALENFDYVSPMVYPSHYPRDWSGIPNPNTAPYQVIKLSMGGAVERAIAATTSPDKLRPWLQDFSIFGVTYTPDMVRAQIKATEEVGLDSWLMWNASNRYTREAYEVEGEVVSKPHSTASSTNH